MTAHDRRGHGRSTQTATGNEMDTYASDIAQLVEALDLKDSIHIGHSTGGDEVVRYITNHGTSRVSKAVLISAVTPTMAKSATNPDGVPMEVFDEIRLNAATRRQQYFQDFTLAFYGYNRDGANVQQGVMDNWWRQGMMGGIKAHYERPLQKCLVFILLIFKFLICFLLIFVIFKVWKRQKKLALLITWFKDGKSSRNSSIRSIHW